MIRPARLAALASVGTATLIVGTAPAQASATYSVSARTYTRDGNVGGTECYYNESGIGGTGCSNIFNAGDGRTGTGSVTPGTGSTATKAAIAAGQTAYNSGAYAYAANSMVTDDLATASLHFFAQDNGDPGYGVGSSSSAAISDELHFTAAPGATASTVTAIGVTFTVGGTFHPNGSNDNSSGPTEAGDFNGTLTLGGRAANFSFANNSTTGFTTIGTFYQYPLAFETGSWTHDAANTSATFTGIYYFTGASIDAAVTLGVNFGCDNGLTCDFSNTLSFSLPTGVSYTSDSGVFLTAGATGAIPEPTSWALLVAGFGIVGLAARRRRIMVAA
ncbi:MAG: PEPxxWA-CTERM sorting domain-containing protein [Janthinobacterium lividum]